jgi:superfamily I DNA/RNA helicase
MDAPTIRVEAGPGTGKTFGLGRRIVRLMHPTGLSAPGNEILVVAFNRVIAKQLRQEITDTLSKSGMGSAEPPVIRTVHALCLEAIERSLRLLLPHERDAMLFDVLCQYKGLQKKFETKKNADQALRDHEAKHRDHAGLWQAVHQWLRRHHAQLISELPAL